MIDVTYIYICWIAVNTISCVLLWFKYISLENNLYDIESEFNQNFHELRTNIKKVESELRLSQTCIQKKQNDNNKNIITKTNGSKKIKSDTK